jgi:TetR/AcrR family fatty acid metabolism transcriptional regulator
MDRFEQNRKNDTEKARDRTRTKILLAATSLFGQQGVARTTISQIARKAGVTPGCVYKHFQKKEDIYYYIPAYQIKKTMPAIEEALFGIQGALNQLRKYLWDYVREMTQDREWARIVFLQLKTSQHFMQTEHYKEVKAFYQKIIKIMQMGQESGEIDPTVNLYSARILVLGSLEHIMIRWLLKDCSYDVFEHLNGCLKIIEDGLRVKSYSKSLPGSEK